MEINFENDFQNKLMSQEFAEATTLETEQDVLTWRQKWMDALTSWHSPYKAVIDCTNLTVRDKDEVRDALDRMVRFHKGFFLRKAAGYGHQEGQGHDVLPFPVHNTFEEATAEVGVRKAKKRQPGDFRSSIQFQNHFRQHAIELSFAEPVTVSTKEQVETIKSKFMNNLMQWHSKWSLIVDCSNLEVGADAYDDFERLLKTMKGFFMKDVVGYAPKGSKDSYPFPVYRARHRAVTQLQHEGNFSGDEADCQSRKFAP